jgi:SNF2 family DNA or RNA helicase
MEIMEWLGEDVFAQIIVDAKTPLLKVPAYIVSMDLLRRLKDFPQKLIDAGVKIICIDECQQIKNPESERTVQVRSACQAIGRTIALSGTPIKNNAGEYFPILNILQPKLYPRYSTFVYNDTDNYFNGYSYKIGGLKDPEGFKKRTKDFIIRRERLEVLPDLPIITRKFSFHELAEEVEDRYRKAYEEFEDAYNSGEFNGGVGSGENILAYLSKMRHITGLSKIDPCIDHCMEFLGSTDRKMTIFTHHRDVAEILYMKFGPLLKELELSPPITLYNSGDKRDDLIRTFREDPRSRIMIASTLADGEGTNLQFCSDFIILERQWNPANEEQVEGRFSRIGQLANKINCTYFIAVGTVDEFFSEIVERKREIVTNTLGGKATIWDQSSLIKELTETLAQKGGLKWKI